jgi:PAS domain S-box-containing protein
LSQSVDSPVRILFVDDSEDDVLLAANALRRDGLIFTQGTASNLAEARASMERERWSVIISDYNLGLDSGLEILAAARELCADVPFILLSGTVGEERAVEAIRMGAADYVMKDRVARLAPAIRREIDAAHALRVQATLESRLRAAEERYRRTFECAPVGIANTDVTGAFLSVNARFCETIGYSEEELLGRRFNEFSFIDDAGRAMAEFRAIVEGQSSGARYQRRYVRKNGELSWADVTLAAVHDDHGAVEYVIGLVEDINDRKEAHDKLLLQARLLECVEQAVIATDLQGRVVYWNRFAERLYGWRAEEALGARITELTPAEGFRADTDSILAHLHQGDSWTGELRIRRRDGSSFPALVIDAPVFDEAGTLIGMVGVSSDLTEQKRVENTLREHRLQLSEAQEIARVGSWTFDFATGERQWSDNFLRLYGVEPGAAATIEEAFQRIHPDDRPALEALYVEAHSTFKPATANFRALTPAGMREMLLRYTFELDNAGRPQKAIGVVQDITEERKLEEELRRRTMQQTEVANLGQFALSATSVQSVLDHAVSSIKTALGFHCAAVMRCGGGNWHLSAGEECPAMNSMLGLRVPIHSATGDRWGVLGGAWNAARAYASHDLEFLQSIATVVGQALDRASADAELHLLARQQSAIAEMGRLVLSSVDNEVFEKACELLIAGTGADYAFVAEATGSGGLRVRAGRLWGDPSLQEGLTKPGTQLTTTARNVVPVIVDDYRLAGSAEMREATVPYGVLSGATVPVVSATRTYGILSAQSRTASAFRAEDAAFMQSLANILAEALEREHAHRQLEASEHRYRRIFDGAAEVIFSLDTSGCFTTLNPAFEEITGWSRHEWLGRSFEPLIAPEDLETVKALFQELLGGRVRTDAALTLLGSDRLIHVDVSCFVRAEEGEVREIYGFARDVTASRRAEAERERVTRSLQLLLESTVEGIYTIDLDGNCTMVNRAAAAFLGTTPEEIIGRKVHELMHAVTVEGLPNADVSCPIYAVLRDGEPRSVTSDVFRRTDGEFIPVAYSAAPIVDGGQRVGAVVTFTDLTERRKLETRLEQANRLSSLGRLAATVAHEFNNVLMGIAPFVEVIRRGPSPQKISVALDHIGSAVTRGRRITEDILRFTQPAQPVRASMEVEAWLSAIGVEARSLLGSRYSISIDAVPLWIEADAGQLHQIFMNLILNARDAMPQGGRLTLAARREAADAKFPFGVVDDPSRYVHLIASDTGCGMSEETLRHAFEPLFTTKRNGTGLGLAVTHQVVRRHGGEIFIESTPGAGTSFHLFLPMGNTPSLVAAEGAGERSAHHQHAGAILLVEDDTIVSAGLSTILEANGFAVRAVETAAAALEAVAADPPDAVVLDVGLPDMDGRSVYARIAELQPELPVVFSTGHTDRAGLEELLMRPNVAYLRKPYESAALLEVLAEVMHRPD